MATRGDSWRGDGDKERNIFISRYMAVRTYMGQEISRLQRASRTWTRYAVVHLDIICASTLNNEPSDITRLPIFDPSTTWINL